MTARGGKDRKMKKIHRNGHEICSDVIDILGSSEESSDIKLEVELQLEREKKSAAEIPEFYKLADIMNSAEGSAYRNGEYNGKRYMTNEDYNNMILDRTRIPQYVMSAAASNNIVPRPAAAYNIMGCGKQMVGTGVVASVCKNVICGEEYSLSRVERASTDIGGALLHIFEKWFPAHTIDKENRRQRRRLASSAAGIAWVLIFALVLALPITVAVLKSEAIADLNAKQKELHALEITEADLIAEFESGLDLRYIENVAVNEIGMIKLNESTIKVLKLNEIDSIESFNDKKSNSVVPALLSALGIRSEDE